MGAHFPFTLVSGLFLLAAMFAPLRRLPLPACSFLQLTGYPCPFCGGTRAFVDMAHGRFLEAFAGHPLAALLYAMLILVFAWHSAAMLFGVVLRRGRVFCLSKGGRRLGWGLAALALIGVWIYRLNLGLK